MLPGLGALHLTSLLEKLERAKGFEPSTPTLARLCSTPELHPHPKERTAIGTVGHGQWRGQAMPNGAPLCNRGQTGPLSGQMPVAGSFCHPAPAPNLAAGFHHVAVVRPRVRL